MKISLAKLLLISTTILGFITLLFDIVIMSLTVLGMFVLPDNSFHLLFPTAIIGLLLVGVGIVASIAAED